MEGAMAGSRQAEVIDSNKRVGPVLSVDSQCPHVRGVRVYEYHSEGRASELCMISVDLYFKDSRVPNFLVA